MKENCKERILIVDDEETNIDILMEILGEDYDIYAATDTQTALEILKEEKIDLLLLDVLMPDINGFELCKLIKGDEDLKDIPVIFITALTDEESIEKAFEVGGNDYITKPFKPKEVIARVKTQLKLKKYQEKLKELAIKDPLTGLYNRRYFSEVAEIFQRNKKRYGKKLSVILMDIDNFKKINDTYGHKVGDEVLKALARILKESVRKSDVPVRFGGEEFLLLLPETHLKQATETAERIREKVENTLVSSLEGNIKFTVSIGVAEVSQNEEIEKAVIRADNALYEAKRSGKNRVVVSYT